MFWMSGLVSQRLTLISRLLVITLLPVIVCINGAPVLANDIDELEVSEEEGVYYIKASVVLRAPAEYVRNVLTDYVHIYRLNPSIIESEVLTSPGNDVARIRTKVIGCIASYCEELERVEEVRMLASGDIQAVILPDSGQFNSGFTLWQIQSIGEHARLTYHAEIEPGFFIPPVIGSYIVKAKLREELTTSFARLEKIAHIQSQRDWDPELNFPNKMAAINTGPCDKNVAGKDE